MTSLVMENNKGLFLIGYGPNWCITGFGWVVLGWDKETMVKLNVGNGLGSFAIFFGALFDLIGLGLTASCNWENDNRFFFMTMGRSLTISICMNNSS